MEPKLISFDDIAELLDIAEDFQKRGKAENAAFLIGFAGRIRRQVFGELEEATQSA